MEEGTSKGGDERGEGESSGRGWWEKERKEEVCWRCVLDRREGEE